MEQARIESPRTLPEGSCTGCWKPTSLCVCAEVRPLANQLEVLILQHPQETKNPLSTTRLLSASLKNCTHRIGLCWRSLSQALGGRPALASEWVVLFVGAKKEKAKLPPESPFSILTKGKKAVDSAQIRGIVILDGNWKQSKTLWWRNPWLLKLPRIVLNPEFGSQYGEIRRQPRKGNLSSIEAAAFCLQSLGENSEVSDSLQGVMKAFVEKARALPRPPREC